MNFKDDLNNRAMVINDLTETIDKYEKLYENVTTQKRKNNGTVRTSSRFRESKNVNQIRNLYGSLPNTKAYIDALKAEHKQRKDELVHILLEYKGDMQELLKDKEISKAVGRIVRPKLRKMESAQYNLSAMNMNVANAANAAGLGAGGAAGAGGEATAEENALANLMKGVKFRRGTRKQRGGAKGLLKFLLSILASSIVLVDTPTAKKAIKESSTNSLTSYREPAGVLAGNVVPVGGTSTSVFVGEHIPKNRVAGILPDPTFDSEMGELHNHLMSFLTPKEYKELMARIRGAYESGQHVEDAMMKYFREIGKANI